MTIREVINELMDAPDKDKPFIIECRKDVLKNHNYEWGPFNLIKIVNCTQSSVGIIKIDNCTHSSVVEEESEDKNAGHL